ncbi:MAG: flagellar biosynthesis protein [Alphaproteobacteria bacterium]|nr:flagellar biosynthesis protein [Alphaproteobacteria bacterium]
MNRKLRLAALFAVLCLLAGCATSRSVVDLGAAGAEPVNPAQGQEVVIATVEDARVFETAPRSPDIPSLSPSEANDPGIRARAIARKRNTFGQALGDVLLPEGQTVSDATQRAIVAAFRRAGYRVLAPGDAGHERAVPVAARIERYWTWFTPGFWAVTVQNRAEVTLSGALPALQGGLTVTSEVSESMQAVFESDWQQVSAEGLAALSARLTAALNARRPQ